MVHVPRIDYLVKDEKSVSIHTS